MFNYNFLSILLEKNAIYLCTCVCCAKIEKAANYPPLHIHLSSPHRKYNNNDCDIKKKRNEKKNKKGDGASLLSLSLGCFHTSCFVVASYGAH